MIEKFNKGIKFALSFLVIYLYYTAKPHLINPLHKLRVKNEKKAKAALKRESDLWEIIQYMLNQSSSTGCEYSDLYELYKLIIYTDYRYILELGSGISTAVIAYAIKKSNSDNKTIFVSMEEDEKYYEEIRNIFPPQLATYVKFNLSKRVEKLFKGHLGCHYAVIPDYPYEFIFIDGPTLRRSDDAPKCFNADIINITQKFNSPIKAVLDQRISTYWILKKLLFHSKIKYHPIKKITIIQTNNV